MGPKNRAYETTKGKEVNPELHRNEIRHKLHAEIERHRAALESPNRPSSERDHLLSMIEGQTELGFRLGLLTRRESDELFVCARDTRQAAD
ncbi:hypothetical protein VXJ36_22895 [Pseudomonas nitroreducens]|uniref:hypothetical protein n=1 Tax=Pseudomonas nitroreducens TaxID=46680 RepID=UPI002F3609D8